MTRHDPKNGGARVKRQNKSLHNFNHKFVDPLHSQTNLWFGLRQNLLQCQHLEFAYFAFLEVTAFLAQTSRSPREHHRGKNPAKTGGHRRNCMV